MSPPKEVLSLWKVGTTQAGLCGRKGGTLPLGTRHIQHLITMLLTGPDVLSAEVVSREEPSVRVGAHTPGPLRPHRTTASLAAPCARLVLDLHAGLPLCGTKHAGLSVWEDRNVVELITSTCSEKLKTSFLFFL